MINNTNFLIMSLLMRFTNKMLILGACVFLTFIDMNYYYVDRFCIIPSIGFLIFQRIILPSAPEDDINSELTLLS